jgi:hypothetical protein
VTHSPRRINRNLPRRNARVRPIGSATVTSRSRGEHIRVDQLSPLSGKAYDAGAVPEDDIATYRAMTPAQRLALAIELSDWFWKWLDVPDRATGDRKLAAWQREHDLSNEAMIQALLERDRGGPRE